MGLKIRKTLALLIAAAGVGILILVDFVLPDQVFLSGMRDVAAEFRHPGYAAAQSPEGILYSAGFLANFAGSILVLFGAPGRAGVIARQPMTPRTLVRFLFAGAAASMVLAGVIILSLFSPFTFPFTALSGLTLLAASLLGSVSLLLRLGNEILLWAGWRPTALLSVGYGQLLFTGLISIPGVGWVFWLLLWLLAVGAVFYSRFGSENKWTLSPLFEELEK